MTIPDCVSLEMQMAELMAQQEASGFRFDMEAAERIRDELSREAENITEKILAIYRYYPGKVFTPKRTAKKTGYVAGAPMTKLVDFNPTSRNHIYWALKTFRGARFTKVTDSGRPKVDEAVLSEIRDNALSASHSVQIITSGASSVSDRLAAEKETQRQREQSRLLYEECEMFICLHHIPYK